MTSDTAKKKRFIIITSIILISLLLVLAVYFSTYRKCTASDLKSRSPIKTTGSGFTQEAACRKALATCSLYSTWPMDCKVVE